MLDLSLYSTYSFFWMAENIQDILANDQALARLTVHDNYAMEESLIL